MIQPNMKRRSRDRSIRKKLRTSLIRLIVLMIFAALVMAACQPDPKNRFPTLTTASQTRTASSTKPTDTPSSSTPITLRIAGPFTAEAAEALRQLYLIVASGQITRTGTTPIGDRFKPGGAVPDDASLTIRFEPITLDAMMDGSTYKAMAAAGTLPDVFVTGDVGSLVKLNAVADLTASLTTLDTKAAARIPIFALEALRSNGQYWGVPYLATVPILMMNNGLADQLGLKLPAGSMTAVGMTDALIQTSGNLQQLSRPQTIPTPVPTAAVSPTPSPTPSPFLSVSAIADLRPFLKFWPASSDASLGYAAYQNGRFRFEATAVSETLQLLRGLDRNQMTPSLTLSKADLFNQAASRSAFRNNQTVFLIDDSGRLPEWSVQSLVQTRALDLPLGRLTEARSHLTVAQPTLGASPPAVVSAAPAATPKNTPRPLPSASPAPDNRTAAEFALAARQAFKISAYCVSAKTAYPSTAARVAMFLAQDPDALMLQNQYVQFEGYLPLSHDPDVWDRLVGKQVSNTVLSESPLLRPYYNRLRRGYADPSIMMPGFESALYETLLSADRFLPEFSIQSAALTALSEKARSLLKEGS